MGAENGLLLYQGVAACNKWTRRKLNYFNEAEDIPCNHN